MPRVHVAERELGASDLAARTPQERDGCKLLEFRAIPCLRELPRVQLPHALLEHVFLVDFGLGVVRLGDDGEWAVGGRTDPSPHDRRFTPAQEPEGVEHLLHRTFNRERILPVIGRNDLQTVRRSDTGAPSSAGLVVAGQYEHDRQHETTPKSASAHLDAQVMGKSHRDADRDMNAGKRKRVSRHLPANPCQYWWDVRGSNPRQTD
jgi:hypothetical protein